MGSYSSSSSTNIATTTDKRQVVDGKSLGVTADDSTVNITSVDSDIVRDAIEMSKYGLDRLLGAAENMFNSSANSTAAGIDAINTAANDARGTLDQKTIIMIAVAGVVALFALKKG